MKKKLIQIALASLIATGTGHAMASQDNEDTGNNKKQVTAIGLGAVGGAILAGPAGLVVGGIVGAIAGRDNSKSEVMGVDHLAETESMLTEMIESSKENIEPPAVMVASLNNNPPVIDSETSEVVTGIQNIISNDLKMDVYFKAGSVDVENFYTKQLSVLSNLLAELPDLELILDGYSDRQGSKDANLQLSVARLESVREYFNKQGIDDSRITVNAYGEKNFVSTAGDLDAYVFDRRVEVSFKTTTSQATNSLAAINNKPSF